VVATHTTQPFGEGTLHAGAPVTQQ